MHVYVPRFEFTTGVLAAFGAYATPFITQLKLKGAKTIAFVISDDGGPVRRILSPSNHQIYDAAILTAQDFGIISMQNTYACVYVFICLCALFMNVGIRVVYESPFIQATFNA